jgi:energy-coupling factor transporter ATP-binding protein EcfA2
MGALIELGAGFNPVLTGRENVYVNAAVLGIPKRRVDTIIDDIIEFSGIKEFIDAPVMSYSSGMRVRLGFAVAAELAPDVLLIDEVLAVGDLAFRTKCLNRLNEMKGSGMSFILVSHHMTNIVQFTERAIWLDGGRLVMDGSPLEVTKAYVNSGDAGNSVSTLYGEVLIDHPDVESASVKLEPESGKRYAGTSELAFGEFLTIEYDFGTRRELASPNVSFPIYHENGTLMTTVASIGSGISLRRSDGGSYSGKVRFGPINFNPANYIVVANLHNGPQHLHRSVVGRFSISNNARMTWGAVDFDQDWQVAQLVEAK